jgi:hypothetical protein
MQASTVKPERLALPWTTRPRTRSPTKSQSFVDQLSEQRAPGRHASIGGDTPLIFDLLKLMRRKPQEQRDQRLAENLPLKPQPSAPRRLV